MSNVMYEAFSGNRIVKAFLMEKSENRRFAAVTQRLFVPTCAEDDARACLRRLWKLLGCSPLRVCPVCERARSNPQIMIAFIVVRCLSCTTRFGA